MELITPIVAAFWICTAWWAIVTMWNGFKCRQIERANRHIADLLRR